MLAFVLIFLFVPETKQLTLEELDYVFSVPHKTFINHQFTKSLPYFLQHTVLRRDVPRPEPLVKFEKQVAREHHNTTGEQQA
jgi:hypothetical protein